MYVLLFVINVLVCRLAKFFPASSKWTGGKYKNINQIDRSYMEKNKAVGIENQIGVTAIIGSHGCKSNIILEGLSKTVPFVRGFLFADMDQIINWRMDLQDKMTGFFEFIKYNQTMFQENNPKDPQPIRHLVMCSFPQTNDQLDRLLEFCPKLRIAFIELPNNKDDESFELAMGFKEKHRDQFISVNHSRPIHYQAEHILRGMDILPAERNSMRNSICAKNSMARAFFDETSRQKQKPTRSLSEDPKSNHPENKTPDGVSMGRMSPVASITRMTTC